MSKYLTDGKATSTKEIFRKKNVYKMVSRSSLPNLVDFTFAEKALYGRVDRSYRPITANELALKMTDLSSGTIRSIKVYNFVADAFHELQNKFKIKAISSEIDTEDDFLTDIVPVGGYIDPNILYENYQRAYIMGIGNVLKNNRLQFYDFDEFIAVAMPYIMNTLKTKSFTYAGFIKSKECPIHVSGLVIDIGTKIKPNDDEFKYEKFYQSRNWDFFLNACNTYGFMVDSNMPNRLVADIASTHMVEKMRLYEPEINSTDAFLLGCYNKPNEQDFQKFKRFFYSLYSENKKTKYLTTTQVHSDNTRAIIRDVKSYTYQEFLNDYSNEYFFKLYSKIRFAEEESTFTESEMNSLTENTLELMRLDLNSGFGAFETIINKTFDYNGSLSYIINRQKLLRR